MSAQPPSDPYGQEPAGRPNPPPPPSYGGPGYPGGSGGSVNLGQLVFIGAWVLLGIYVLSFLYQVSQDDYGDDAADRFFSLAPQLGSGIFQAGLLLGVSVWLRRND